MASGSSTDKLTEDEVGRVCGTAVRVAFQQVGALLLSSELLDKAKASAYVSLLDAGRARDDRVGVSVHKLCVGVLNQLSGTWLDAAHVLRHDQPDNDPRGTSQDGRSDKNNFNPILTTFQNSQRATYEELYAPEVAALREHNTLPPPPAPPAAPKTRGTRGAPTMGRRKRKAISLKRKATATAAAKAEVSAYHVAIRHIASGNPSEATKRKLETIQKGTRSLLDDEIQRLINKEVQARKEKIQTILDNTAETVPSPDGLYLTAQDTKPRCANIYTDPAGAGVADRRPAKGDGPWAKARSSCRTP